MKSFKTSKLILTLALALTLVLVGLPLSVGVIAARAEAPAPQTVSTAYTVNGSEEMIEIENAIPIVEGMAEIGGDSKTSYVVNYEVTGTTGTDEGLYPVTVTGKGNYKDTAVAAWEIVQRDANTRTFIGTIDWRDGGRDHTGSEPPALTLYRTTGEVPENPAEGTPITDAVPKWNEDNTIFTYSGLRVFDANGNLYSYWVIESKLDGYEEPQYHNTCTNPKNDRLENGGKIINYIKQEKIAITGTVTWKHGSNSESNRPKTVTVHLQGNGLDLPYKVITLDGTKDNREGSEDVELDPDPIDENIWRFQFGGLDKYESSTAAEHIYTVREDHVANYTTTYNDSRLNITNTYNTNTLGDILRVRKTVDVSEGQPGWTWDDNAKFVFGLFGVSNTAGVTQPMPSGSVYGDGVYKLIEVNKDSAEHEAGFGAVSFDKPGTYVYSVRELTPAESGTSRLPGMTYDTEAYTVTIIVDEEMKLSTTVTDQAGKTIESAGENNTLTGKTNTDSYVLPFTNHFAGTQVDYVMTAGNSYTDPSQLDGDGRPLNVIGEVNGKFGFTMRPVGNNAASAPMPSGVYSSDTGTGLQGEGADRVYYAKNVNGRVLFGEDAAHAISYTAKQAGTYSYELAEVIPDDAVYIGSGFWYNDVDETVYDGVVHTLTLTAQAVDDVLTVTLSEDQNDTCLDPGTGTKYKDAKNGARRDAAGVINSTVYPRRKNGVPLFSNYKDPKIDVTAKKVWDDANDQDGMRPGHVSFLIERSDGQPFRDVYGNILNSKVTIAGTDSANFEAEWSNLPRYKRRDDGIYEQITYKVFESANGEPSINSVPGYADQVITGDDEKGFTITNKHVPELRGVAVTMQWNDDDDRDGKRPVGVTFHLDQTKAGELTQTVTPVIACADNGWKATWLGLPARYGDSSKEFDYVLQKASFPDCYTVENYVEGKSSMQVRIPEGITPLTDKAVVWLTKDGSVTGDQIELSRAGNWTGTFEGILTPSGTGDYSQYGVAIYGTDIGIENGDLQKTIIRNYTITGTYTPERRDLTVRKAWEMRGAGMVGVRQPDSIRVRLKANGKYLGEAVTLAETNQWQHTWSDLYKYEGGSPIDYTVEELNIPAYYTRSDEQSDNRCVITNTFNIDVTKAPAARPELAYNGNAQDLITAGEASNGTFLYALSKNENTAPADNLYSTSIPTATDAGTYYVWYKVEGDENHNGTEAEKVNVNITKAVSNTVSVDITDWTYGDEAKAPTSETTFGSAAYTYSDAENGTFTDKVPAAAGKWYVKATVADTNNYDGCEAVKEFTISKKKLTITADSGTKVYDGNAFTKNSYTSSGIVDGDSIESVTITGSQTVVGKSDNVPSGALIKKGDSDVTANYDIIFEKGTLSVTKATPEYTTPDDKTITCKQTLKNIELEKGFSFTDPDKVLAFGENTVNVKYTPADVANYNVVENIEIKVTVNNHVLTKTNAAEATCEKAGNSEYWTCSECGKHFSDAEGKTEITEGLWVIGAKGHTFDKEVVDAKYLKSAADCTHKAVYYKSCECGEKGTETFEYGEVPGHNYGEPTYTWSEDGKACTATAVCANDAKHVLTEEATVTSEVTTPSTCKDMGKTTYTAAFTNKNFTTQTKEVTDVAKLTTHTPKAAVKEKEVVATCEKAGSYEEVVYCSVCNKELSRETKTVDKLGHKMGDWVVTTPATETTKGVETRTCTRKDCNYSETRDIPMPSHEHTYEKVEAKDASCSKEGNIEYWTCKGCGKLFADKDGKNEINVEDTVIEKAAHTPGKAVKEKEVAATCEEDGSYDEVVYCSVCKAEISRKKVTVHALGHSFGEWVKTKDPSETEPGLYTRTCKNDPSHTETKEIPVTTHKHKIVPVTEVPATCTNDGVKAHYICSECDLLFEDADGTKEILDESTLVIKGSHKGGKATCSHKAVCEVCHEEYDELDPDNHEGETEVRGKVDATCTADGFSGDVYCKACNKLIENGNVVKATGHDYGTPEYKWSDDGKTCTATVICKRDGCTESSEGHKVTENAVVTSKVKEAATTEKMGTTTYTATFKNALFTTQTKDVADIPKLDKQSDKPADKPSDNPVDNPSDKPADKPQDTTTPVETTTAPAVKEEGTTLSVAETKAEVVVTSKAGEEPTVTYKGTTDTAAKEVTVPDSVTVDGVTYKVTLIAKEAFKGNKTLEKATVGENIETVGDKAFAGCTNLKTIVIKESVKEIGNSAFEGCSKLSTITLGKNVEKVGNKAFANCKSLTKIIIPKSTKKIGNYAFKGNKKLKTIIVKTTKLTKKTVAKRAFSGVGNKVTIKVPKSKKKVYKKLFRKRGLSKKVKVI